MNALLTVLNAVTLAILLYLAVLTWRHVRRVRGLVHQLTAASIAITDPELRRAAAADAHITWRRR